MRKKFIPAAIAAIVIFLLSSFVRADDQPGQNDEALKLAAQLNDAVMRQDNPTAEGMLDIDALYDRLSTGVNASDDFAKGFKEGFQGQAHEFMDAIVKAGGDGAYHFLRVRQINGETHILFRILPEGGGVNYHDWIVGKDKQGHLKLQDAYIATTGESLSQTMHRIYLQGALSANPGLMDRLTGKDKELADNLSKVLDLGQAMHDANYKKVLYDYKALPTSLQDDKNCMVMRLLASENLRDALPQEYTDAMADYKRLFPGDPSVDLDCIDALFESKQYDEARKSLDRINTFTGGDPYLLILRGNTYKLEGGDANILLAKQTFQKAIEEEPTLADAYWAEVTLSLETKEYDDTAALLTQIQQKLHLKLNDLTKVPSYAGFVKSEAYKKWLAAQTPDTPATPSH